MAIESKQIKTLAFDVYGTLIDTADVVRVLRTMVGDQAEAFAMQWREKQLEYAFRRGLMGQYVDFSVCTEQALQYTCVRLALPLSTEQQRQLLAHYEQLVAFADVAEALAQCHAQGHRLWAFSNGSAQAVTRLLEQAQIKHWFEGVISVEAVQCFKPSPRVYQHFLQATASQPDNTWLISSNAFDVLGAQAVGWHTIWVQRSRQNQFDPWGAEPTCTVESLLALPKILKQENHLKAYAANGAQCGDLQ